MQRLSKLAKEFNVGIQTIVEFLHKKGFVIDSNPNTKVSDDACILLEKEYKSDVSLKRESEKITLRQLRPKKEVITLEDLPKKETDEDETDEYFEVRDLKKTAAAATAPKTKEKPAEHHEEIPREAFIKPFKIIDKIELNDLPGVKKKPAEVQGEKHPEKPAPVLQKKKTEQPKEPAQPAGPVIIPEENIIEPVIEAKKPEEKALADTVVEVIPEPELTKTDIPKVDEPKVVGKIDLDSINTRMRPDKKSKEEKEKERKQKIQQEKEKRQKAEKPEETEPVREPKAEVAEEILKIKAEKLAGPVIVGKIELPAEKEPKGALPENERRKKRRKRIQKDTEKVSVQVKG